MEGNYWETVACSITALADRDVYSFTYEGFYWALKDVMSGYAVGDAYSIPEDEGGGSGGLYQGVTLITGIGLHRKVGDLGELTIQVSALYKREIWNIDFAEVSKDIRTWLVMQYTDSDGNVDPRCWDELLKIKLWEVEKDNDNYADWADFLYHDNYGNEQALEGDTLALAKKMMRGVQNYSTYWPVITRTTVRPFMPYVGQIGKKSRPNYEQGWYGFNGEPLPDDWLALAKEWLKTAERSSSNADGTFGLVEQWQGVDMIDKDLYPSAN